MIIRGGIAGLARIRADGVVTPGDDIRRVYQTPMTLALGDPLAGAPEEAGAKGRRRDEIASTQKRKRYSFCCCSFLLMVRHHSMAEEDIQNVIPEPECNEGHGRPRYNGSGGPSQLFNWRPDDLSDCVVFLGNAPPCHRELRLNSGDTMVSRGKRNETKGCLPGRSGADTVDSNPNSEVYHGLP